MTCVQQLARLKASACCVHDNVYLLALLHWHLPAAHVLLRAHLLGLPACSATVHLVVDFEERPTHRLDLFLDYGVHVEDAKDGAHVLVLSVSSQAQPFLWPLLAPWRVDLPGGRRLSGEEASELGRGLHNQLVTGDICLKGGGRHVCFFAGFFSRGGNSPTMKARCRSVRAKGCGGCSPWQRPRGKILDFYFCQWRPPWRGSMGRPSWWG